MRFPIRSKLAGALALPMIALMGVAAFEVKQADREANEVELDAALATAAVGPGSLIAALQDERNYTAVELIGLQATLVLPVNDYPTARTAVDNAVVQLRAFVEARGEELGGVFDNGLAALDANLTSIRAEVDASTAPRELSNAESANAVFERYAVIIEALLGDTAGIATRVDNTELRTGSEIVSLATQALESSASIVRSILLPTLTGDVSLGARANAALEIARYQRGQEDLLARSLGPFAGLPEEAVLSADTLAQDAAFQAFVDTGDVDIIAFAELLSSDAESGSFGLRSDAAAILQQEADRLLGEAQEQRRIVILLGALAVAAAGLITVLASRSITNPLRSLTRQARDMATVRLPAAVQTVLETPLGDDVVVPEVVPITVRTRDEVADVAVALNTVQGSALDLALEQAVLRRNIADSFVNLSRRNQNLLDRQLDFITELEHQEKEPERLEGLFRLDHLATRMRRNAESLLRLAGGGDSTHSSWAGPVPIVDVVRGALGEVENYQRVDVRSLESATVTASAGADLAHAVAELIENALSFSPPHERVEIRGRRNDNGGYTMAVIDQGVGMSEEQLDVANRRLAGEESFNVAPSRYLGHYVAGYLAKTHGIEIQLEAAPVGGLTARVEVPPSLLVDDQPYARPAASPVVAPAPSPAPDPWRTPRPDVTPVVSDSPLPTPAREPVPVPAVDTERDADSAADYVNEDPADRIPMPVGNHGIDPGVDRDPLVARRTPAEGIAEIAAGNGGGVPALSALSTSGGLARRVRGANAPTATNVAAAFGGADNSAPTPSSSPSADDVASFLSAFHGGVERGLSDAQREARTEEDQ